MTNQEETIIEQKKNFSQNNKKSLIIGALILLVFIVMGQLWYITRLKQEDAISTETGLSQPSNAQKALNRSDAVFDWDPFTEMQRMQRDINSLFRNSLFKGERHFDMGGMFPRGSFFEPDVDVQEKKDKYIVKIDVPGMEKDKIKINIEDNYMSIEGERAYETKQQSKDDSYFRAERSFGSFSRTIPLPGEVNKEGITADYQKGVLTVVLPKLKEGYTKNKEINISIV